MSKDWPALISKLPPQLSLLQASKMLRRKYTTVRRNLLVHGYHARDGRSLRFDFIKPKSRVKWERVDWGLSNIGIGHKYKVSRELVRRMRNRLGKPFVESRGKKRKANK